MHLIASVAKDLGSLGLHTDPVILFHGPGLPGIWLQWKDFWSEGCMEAGEAEGEGWLYYLQLSLLEKQSLVLSAVENIRQKSSLHEGYQIRECLFKKGKSVVFCSAILLP